MAAEPARKHARRGQREVVAVLRNGRRLSSNHFELRFLIRASEIGKGALAIAVPKRLVRSAVARNRIKRILRENFRLSDLAFVPVDILATFKGAEAGRSAAGRQQLNLDIKGLIAKVVRTISSARGFREI